MLERTSCMDCNGDGVANLDVTFNTLLQQIIKEVRKYGDLNLGSFLTTTMSNPLNKFHLIESFLQVMFIVSNPDHWVLLFAPLISTYFHLINSLWWNNVLLLLSFPVWNSFGKMYAQSLGDFNSQLSKLWKQWKLMVQKDVPLIAEEKDSGSKGRPSSVLNQMN